MKTWMQATDSGIHARRCVQCGYDGPEVWALDMLCCVNCGCDVRDRPPRSYAEMEGLAEPPVSYASLVHNHALSHRWLLFLAGVAVCMFIVGALTAAAFAV